MQAGAEDKVAWIIAEPQPVICNETARRTALISNFLQGGILFFDNFRQ